MICSCRRWLLYLKRWSRLPSVEQDIPEQTLDRRDQFTFAAEGSLGFDFLQTQVSVRPAGNRHSVPGLDLVGVEILAFDVVRLEECEAVFAALISDPSSILRRFPFQSVKMP